MALKAYYDGSGKANSSCKFLTLAGFSASKETWKEVESGWGTILEKHGARYFHFSEATNLKKEFSKENGWDDSRVAALGYELLVHLGTFRKFDETTDLLGFSCTVNLEDYRSLAATTPALKGPTAICVDWCAGSQFQRNPKPSPGYLELYFDRGEEFLHKIDRVWRQRKSRRPYWAEYISTISPIDDMRLSPALQCADFLAGAMSRYHHTGDLQWKVGLVLNAGIFHNYYDRDALMATIST